MKGVLRSRLLVMMGLLALSVVLAACGQATGGGGGGSDSGDAKAASQISGAGSSFVAPFMDKMGQELVKDGGPQVNYQSIGSSGGREQFIQKTVAFGASDAPMDSEEEKQAGGNPKHIATVGGAVVAAYNLEDLGDTPLNLTGTVLADIFLGKITNWNDPAIAELNPNATLPDAQISVVHRSDGSGTTNIFTNYLAAVSPAWKNGPGPGDELQWPTGIGADGNEGVAGQVQQTKNSIGYIGLEYAKENDIPFANIGEKTGSYVQPSVKSAQTAIEQAGENGDIPDDLKVTISSLAPFEGDAYPITGLTWMIVRQQMDDLAECEAVAETAWYITHDGQDFAEDLNYVELPDDIVSADEKTIKGMEAGGKKCYTK
ncbi:MAG TPA: phosphate ABC transporter substrate-binding protein PstS [Rubrobacteraceae bacterium]|nr:phosphate ABC transporter substrate-binding protein PstS [Rubrobacteraceae bacterium]